jgi:hypothetical protein
MAPDHQRWHPEPTNKYCYIMTTFIDKIKLARILFTKYCGG